jgi:hypothetical protein
MPDTPLIGLPLLEASQAQKHVTHNEALLQLDALLHLAVITRSLAAPPALPADGDRYLVAGAASGEWLGHAGEIAFREAGSWRFAIPKTGWRLWVADEALFLLYDGTIWRDLQAAGVLQNVDLLGVGTTADAANRLSVSSPGVLFTHAGSSQQVKVNKNASEDTASLLFQDGFSGRAEMGLTGDDDFHVKVSPDGAAFFEGLTVARTSGLVTARNGLVLDPAAAEPAAPVNGQLWYNSSLGKFRKRQAGVSTDLDTSGAGLGAFTAAVPSLQRSCDAHVTVTADAAKAATLTLPGVAGLFHYISRILIERHTSAALNAAATPTLVTTTNLPGARAFSIPADAAAQGQVYREVVEPALPLKSSASGVATTIAAPRTANVIWRISVDYYLAP